MTSSATPATRYLLAWLDADTMISPSTLVPVRRAIEDKVDSPPELTEIDVWLESPGGDANSAYKLALILRDAASCVRVVVPDYAKSAATLLSLVGDEIYMAPAAELGPLDAQMPEEGSYSGSISALNIARAADEVAREAMDMAVIGGADLLQVTGLSRAQTLKSMLRFSASFSEPLVRQLDPKMVHHAKQMLRVTARYAARLLSMTGGSDAEAVATRLVENFPTHGFVIDIDEAQRLGLPARPIAEYDHLALVRAYHRTAEDGQSMIEFGRLEEFMLAEDDDPTHETGEGGAQIHDQDTGSGDQDSSSPAIDGTQAVVPQR